MAKITELQKYARAKKAKPAAKGNGGKSAATRGAGAKSGAKDIDHFIKTSGLDSQREKEIGQHIGNRYEDNMVYNSRGLAPLQKKYIQVMQWQDLNWLEDVHLGYEEGRAAVFDRNVNGWVTVPEGVKLPDNQQDRDMLARELLIKFQMSPRHPLVDLHKAYRKF
jgi:hypothetical protein